MGTRSSNSERGRTLVLIGRMLHIVLDIEPRRAHDPLVGARMGATGSNHQS
jgi:hypothetical protein